MRNTWLSLLIMTLSIYAVRMLPFLLLRKNITNRFIRSFLFYVPYVTLAVMTFPAILSATANPGAGLCALIVGILVAWFKGDLFTTAVCCCGAAFLFSLIVP